MAKGDKKSKLSKYMKSLGDEDDSIWDDELFLDDDLDSNKTNKKSKLSRYMESIDEKENIDEMDDIDETDTSFDDMDSSSEKPEFDWGGISIEDIDDEASVSKPKKTVSTTLDDYVKKDSKNSTKRETKSGESYSENKERRCIICGKILPKNNISDKCDDCVSKFSLVGDLNELLIHISPGESFSDKDLINHGFNTLKLHILLNKLMDEKLVGLDLKGQFSLANSKRINEFFSLYGDEEDLLDEDVDEIVSLSDDFVDIADYSDYVKIHFDGERQRWIVRLFHNNEYSSQRRFKNPKEANRYALTYLRQLGEISHHKEEVIPEEPNKKTRSQYKGVYYSPQRNKWGATVRGFRGKKFIGHFDTEEEAYLARKKYLDKKEQTKQELISTRRGIKAVKTGNNSGEGIYFSKQSGKWIVRLKNDEGKYVNVGRFDTEEEAIQARDDYLLDF